MALSPIGRVSFPSVYEMTAMDGGKPKFNLTLILRPDKFGEASQFGEAFTEEDQKAKFQAMIDAAQECAMKEFKVKLGEEFKGKALVSPFRKGTEKPDYYDPEDIFIKFSSIKAPNVVDSGVVAIPEASGQFYAGCVSHVTWEVFPYDKGGNRGVGFGLRNVQKVGDGEAFGEVRRSAEEDFAVLDPSKAKTDDIPF